MIKLWRFLSISIVVAVCLGLALVPGVPLLNNEALASGNVTISIEPPLTAVGFNAAFNITVVVDNPDGMPIGNADVRLHFDPTYFNVTNMVNGDMPFNFGQSWDNVTGIIKSGPYMASGTNTTATSILLCTVNCKSKDASGESTVAFLYQAGPPPLKTVVIYGATDYLEGGDMSLMYNGTVKVSGAPVLTVNVTPNGTGTVTANGVTLIGYPNTTNWTTGDNVTLLAVNSTPGWGFHNWTGDPVPATNPMTITMDSDKNVTANFVLLPPQISPDPISLTFNANVGENPANQTLDICNGGGGILNWTANITGTNVTWLSMSPMSGGNLTAAQCSNSTVAVNTTGLTAGTYYANITIRQGVLLVFGPPEGAGSAVGGVAPVNVSVTLNLGVPKISVSPTPLTFTTNEGENPPDQTLEICNTGTGTLNWSLSDGGTAWLSENPTSGSLGAGECEDVTVSVDTTGMEAGDYTATITVTGSPTVSVPVTLHIVSGMPEIPVEPASVSASALDISPQQVKPGQDVTISINVANTGGETGSYNAVLYINSVVEDSQSVSVAGGTSKNVIFTVTKSKAGVYDVSLAGQTGQFEVVGGGWFGGGLGLGTGGIIAIVVIVIALIVAVIFILRGTARPE